MIELNRISIRKILLADRFLSQETVGILYSGTTEKNSPPAMVLEVISNQNQNNQLMSIN